MRDKMTRDASVEVYRCLLMFGICLAHSIGSSDHWQPWLTNMLRACVDGFVFISGYFGITFTWRRFFRIWGIALSCSFLMAIFYDGFLGDGIVHGVEFLKIIRTRMFHHWFMNCYAVLMLLSPALNYLAANVKKEQILQIFMPILFLAFVWCWGGDCLRHIGIRFPKIDGFGHFSSFMMCIVYLAARLYRRFDLQNLLSLRQKWVIFLICALGCMVGFGGYLSPFSIGLGAIVFALLKPVNWPFWVQRVAMVLAPSMFAVYLYHGDIEGQIFVKKLAAEWGGLECLDLLCGCRMLDVFRLCYI